jgi:hypothetical protein
MLDNEHVVSHLYGYQTLYLEGGHDSRYIQSVPYVDQEAQVPQVQQQQVEVK